MARKDISPKYSHHTNANQIQFFRRYITIQRTQNCVVCSVFGVPIILIIFLKSSYNRVGRGLLLTVFKPFFWACWGSQNYQLFTSSTFVSTFHLSSSVLLPTCESWLPCPSPKGKQKWWNKWQNKFEWTTQTKQVRTSSPLLLTLVTRMEHKQTKVNKQNTERTQPTL